MRTTIGYRFSIRDSGEYVHAHLELLEGVPQSAADEHEHAVGGQHEEYYRNRLANVKQASGNAIYFKENYGRARIEFRWQANKAGVGHEGSQYQWYAPTFEAQKFSTETLKLLKRIERALGRLFDRRGSGSLSSCTPLDIVQALGDSCWRVEYGGNVDMWYMRNDRAEHLDKAPEKVPA